MSVRVKLQQRMILRSGDGQGGTLKSLAVDTLQKYELILTLWGVLAKYHTRTHSQSLYRYCWVLGGSQPTAARSFLSLGRSACSG